MEAEIQRVKQKRVRKAPYRKWTDLEQQLLVQFLHDNRPIEKPTAQVYYRRFLAQINSDLDWSLTRCKVKNWRHSYIRARTWGSSAGALQYGEKVKDMVLRMCPLFDELEDIFGYGEFAVSIPESMIDDESAASSENPCTTTNSDQNESYSLTVFADEPEVHSSLVAIKHEALEADFVLDEDELSLKEKESALKHFEFVCGKEKYLDELKCKEAGTRSQEKLKVLELEMKERVALKELEMRERISLRELEMKERIALKELEMKEKIALRELEMKERIEMEKLKILQK